MFRGVGVLVFGLTLSVLFFGSWFLDVLLGFHTSQTGFKVEEGTNTWDMLWVKA